jgi:hypothetical protein
MLNNYDSWLQRRVTEVKYGYTEGWRAFLTAIAIWTISILSKENKDCREFWVSLDDGNFVGWQHLEVYIKGYYTREERYIDTFPQHIKLTTSK